MREDGGPFHSSFCTGNPKFPSLTGLGREGGQGRGPALSIHPQTVGMCP